MSFFNLIGNMINGIQRIDWQEVNKNRQEARDTVENLFEFISSGIDTFERTSNKPEENVTPPATETPDKPEDNTTPATTETPNIETKSKSLSNDESLPKWMQVKTRPADDLIEALKNINVVEKQKNDVEPQNQYLSYSWSDNPLKEETLDKINIHNDENGNKVYSTVMNIGEEEPLQDFYNEIGEIYGLTTFSFSTADGKLLTEEILKANNLDDISQIQNGQTIILPSFGGYLEERINGGKPDSKACAENVRLAGTTIEDMQEKLQTIFDIQLTMDAYRANPNLDSSNVDSMLGDLITAQSLARRYAKYLGSDEAQKLLERIEAAMEFAVEMWEEITGKTYDDGSLKK